MNQLPKAAHQTPEQKALGYLNAAREGARGALFHVPARNPVHKRIETLIRKITEIETQLRGDDAG